jgi:hypothetical protein
MVEGWQQQIWRLVFMAATEQRFVGDRWAQVLATRQIDGSGWCQAHDGNFSRMQSGACLRG